MRKRLDIKEISSVVFMLVLALLLLLSPCKVRNYIQAELGVPQTNVLNKSQSTYTGTSCQVLNLSEVGQTNSKPTLQLPALIISEIFGFGLSSSLLKHNNHSGPLRSLSLPNVPLYILYQNLKVYS